MRTNNALTAVALAWLAWMHAKSPSLGKDEWHTQGAVETLQDCERVVDAALTGLTARGALPARSVTRTGFLLEVTLPSGAPATLRYMCLPENIDPRPR